MSQEITVVVIGITYMKGTSEKGKGSPYEFSQISYLKPCNPHFKNGYMERKEAGFDVATISFSSDPVLWPEFAMMRFGEKVTLILQPDPKDIQKSIVVGFKRDELKKAS